MKDGKKWFVVPVELKATVFVPLAAKDKRFAAREAERLVSEFTVYMDGDNILNPKGPAVAQTGDAVEFATAKEAQEAAVKAADNLAKARGIE